MAKSNSTGLDALNAEMVVVIAAAAPVVRYFDTHM
jgi:hypothetical protein